MGVAPHPGVARVGASFELERLELDGGQLIVRGWWSGVRGVRFVRPGLVVDGRRVLATLEHKPWAVDDDGRWTAAFPWKGGLDVSGVSLVVAPSIEVPLDRETVPAQAPVPRARSRAAAAPRSKEAVVPAAPVRGEVGVVPAAPVRGEVAVLPAAPGTVVHDVTLRDELDGVERRLDSMHAELREARARAAEGEERCRELEQTVARERRAAEEAQDADDDFVRSHAMAILDRDRAMAQHAEAVKDREAAVRARTRMERQCEEALAACEAAQARRAEALAERDEARKQRDDLLLAHQALQAQLNSQWGDESRRETELAPPAGLAPPAELASPADEDASALDDEPTRPLRVDGSKARAAEPGARRRPEPGSPADEPLGVRRIPRARTVAASLHRSQREREHVVTRYDMWAVRILGTVAAVAFISLLLMILKAFFVF